MARNCKCENSKGIETAWVTGLLSLVFLWVRVVYTVCVLMCAYVWGTYTRWIHRSKTHTATVILKSQTRRASRNRPFPFLGWMAFLCLLGSLDCVAFRASLTPILLIAIKRNLFYQATCDLSYLHLLSSCMCLHHYVCFSVQAFLVLCCSFGCLTHSYEAGIALRMFSVFSSTSYVQAQSQGMQIEPWPHVK